MTIKEMEAKLAKLKQDKKKLNEEIAGLEKEIKEQKNKSVINFAVDKNNRYLAAFKRFYGRYLI